MIIKGKGRGRARQLAVHLLRSDENERVRVVETYGTVSRDVDGALVEMEARAAAVNTARPLYHASISPDARTPLSDDQIGVAVDTLARKLGLQAQPRVVVVHRKKGREHVHVVWSRIDIERARVISDAWNYRAHEEAARELEARFGHEPVQGSASCWRSGSGARKRTGQDHEFRQQDRSGRSSTGINAELTALWHASEDGEGLRRSLEDAGYVLARGDRRVFVVIDRYGEVHALARRIEGVDTRAIRVRLRAVDSQRLPSVAEARASVARRPVRAGRRSVCGFRAAADEVAVRRDRSGPKTPAALRVLFEARLTLIETTRPSPARFAPSNIRPLIHRGGIRPAGPYRAQRAILIAAFAAKISAAIRDTRRDELDAILAALMAERDDALRTLSLAHGGNRRPRRCKRRLPASQLPSARRTWREKRVKRGA